MPIRLFWQGSEPLVEWCYLGRERFTHPFFDSTIQLALQRPFNSLFRQHTTMAALGEWSQRSPGMRPSGFIFHMSRCGSTVVSQMLAALAEHVVVSEAGPLDALARAHRGAGGAADRVAAMDESALGQRRAGCEERYFIKSMHAPRSNSRSCARRSWRCRGFSCIAIRWRCWFRW